MSKGKIFVVSIIWLFVLSICAMSYKWWVAPHREQTRIEAEKENKAKLLTETGADSRYDAEINFAADSFSGYAVLRSLEFQQELANKRIKVNLIDDGADYTGRLAKLKSGEVQMAAFTIDALIKTSAELGELPATIVSVIDETRGADAMVSYKSAMPNIEALNHKDTKFVLAMNSPSETLARVVMAHFNLTQLSKDPFIVVKDAEEVYKKYRTAKPEEKQVFVLWQPYVSKMLENPNTHVVVDSSRFRGYIVDVIVVNRNYLYANKDIVNNVIESYFRANYAYQEKINLVLKDSQDMGTPVTPKQAEALVNGIWWKNTQENYCQFGLEKGNLQHIEDMIINITKVLVKTGAIKEDPTGDRPNLLYHSNVLLSLKTAGFHPGVEQVRDDVVVLAKLTDNQWDNLQPLGKLEVPPLVFARGTSILLDSSKGTLDELFKTLKTLPQYYLIIKGDASLVGDITINKALALERANAAKQYLIDKGIVSHRIKAIAVEPTGNTSVDFVLGQLPY